MKQARLAFLLGCTIGLTACFTAAASSLPMRLEDPRPRWVAIEFEISPAERPGQQGALYTQRLPGWLEPDAVPGRLRVTTPGWAVERSLMAAERPVPGSFTDFVWVFEARTGRVLEARVSGAVVRELEFGFFTQEVVTRIEVNMTSDALAGYRAPTRVLGQTLYGYCSERSSSCMLVEGRPYDPSTGLVNAVGGIAASTAGVEAQSFSPLGEARFTEIEASQLAQISTQTSMLRPR